MSFIDLLRLIFAFPGFLVSTAKVVEYIKQRLKKEKK